MTVQGMAKEEAQAVAIFAQFLAQDTPVTVRNGEGSLPPKRSSRNGSRSRSVSWSSRSGSETLPRGTSQPQVTNCSQTLFSLFLTHLLRQEIDFGSLFIIRFSVTQFGEMQIVILLQGREGNFY